MLDVDYDRNPELTPSDATVIRGLSVRDIRFPTSLQADGSDAMHTDPDYSCAYVVLYTRGDVEGYGLTFTLGRGTEIVVQAIHTLTPLIIGKCAIDIFNNFGEFWRSLTSETQMRWVGPEKGVTHLAVAAIINALWDLWARLQRKPVWKLLVDMEPEKLVNCIDFRYISDVITKEEAIKILKERRPNRIALEKELMQNGYPAYTTQVGWLGYTSEHVVELCHQYIAAGFTGFKIKVGVDVDSDKARCALVRQTIGDDKALMIDANQRWDVQEAIEWVKQLAPSKPLWIEEPTSPDDVLGHLAISKALKPFGIGVATGEMCCNRVLFKQFLQSGAMQFCQIDSARVGGINEILSIYLMAYKLGVPVCPHAGGVGLCEMVQHLQMWDYVCLSQTKENRMIEYVDQQHEHFVHPVVVQNAHYMPPTGVGYSTELKREAAEDYEWPVGRIWQNLFAEGKFVDPTHEPVLC